MADDGEEGEGFVEGFSAQGKSLDRLTTHKQLHELLKDVTEKKVSIENDVAKEQDELQKLINKLSKINDDYLRQNSSLSALRQSQKFVLNNDKKREVRGTMQLTLDTFLERRPTDLETERPVHVYFLAGEECGSELHIGREGAGSRDATFLVKLSQTVETLATEAAKYWGLDPKKVFFLDIQGRIVPGNMTLNNIILPPVGQEKKADDTAEGAPNTMNVSALTNGMSGGAMNGEPGHQLALDGAKGSAIVPANEQEGSQEHLYTLRGRDYVLTLVRAKTVLDKEDLSMPKGEKWDDFTFDAAALNKDLEMTRLKRGDEDITAAQVGLDAIPSLFDLMKEGKMRKEKKRKDMWCRIVEFMLFLTMFGSFQYILAPESSWQHTMYTIGKNVRHNISAFTIAEQDVLGINNFEDIQSRVQYNAWLMGPLYRSVFPGGIDTFNVHVLVVQGRTYRSLNPVEMDLNWCPEPVDYEFVNITSTSTSSTTTTSTTTLPETTTTTSTQTTTNGTESVAVSGTCIPYELRYCPTEGAVKVLKKGIELGQVVPGCESMYSKNPLEAWLENLASLDAFTFVNGEVYTYIGGKLADFNFTDFYAWNDTMTDFKPSLTARPPPAKLVNVFVYQPSLEGLLVIQFLTEFSNSGPLINSVRERVLNFQNASTYEWIAYGVAIFFAIVILIMEMQRLLRWPERFVFEERGESVKCSPWIVLFVLLPTLLVLSLALRIYRSSLELDIPKLTSSTMVSEDEEADQKMPTFLMKSMTTQWTESMKTMYNIESMMTIDGFFLLLNLVNFICMVSLFFRFLLMYFPYFSYITKMVRQVVKPLLVVLFMLTVALALFGVVFYVALSDKIFVYRNGLSTAMATIQFAHGGVVSWPQWYREHGWTFVIAMWAGFFVFTLNLNHFAVAVLVSHKKEAELVRNYSSHYFWQLIHRQKYGRCQELNPALVGWDFSGKEPREVKEWPGSK
mmetsp:Transcript_17030/g.31938  ORF Transcript_17030/g.31938 Transcript_17030/m.31938 type:complete len:962 (+) Transcript_17030:73-2958(+)